MESLDPDPRPPTGPGRPRRQGVRTGKPSGHTGEVIKLSGGRRRRTLSAEERVRAVWRPDASISEIERRAGVSRSTAHKWAAVLRSEQQTEELAQ
jgi:hypothetical protein